MLSYRIEPLTDELKSEMLPMQDEYWKQVAEPFHQFPPDVNWNVYMTTQENGSLKIVCGRNDENQLKAVAFVLITNHPHYACICASLPLLWVAPDARKGREGINLIKVAEGVAQMSGAQMMITHGGIHNNVAKIFEFMKYDDFGRYFVKVLPNGPNGVKPVFKRNS